MLERLVPILSTESAVAREVLGDSLVVLACFMSCVGVNLQKWAHAYNESLPVDRRKSMYGSTRWWAGIVMMVLASVMDLAALPLIPLSRVAALGSCTLVANVLLTPYFQRERLTRHDSMGCVVTVLGSASASYFGATVAPTLDQALLLELVTAPLFIQYTVLMTLLMVAYLHLIHGFNRKEQELEADGYIGGPGQPDVLECVWAFDNLDVVCGKRLSRNTSLASQPDIEAGPSKDPSDQHFVTRFGPQFYPAAHASLGGILGGNSIMFAKSTMVLASHLFSEFTFLSLGLTLVGLTFTLLTIWGQIHYLNRGLKVYKDVLFVLPIYQAFWVMSGVAGGLVYYQEYKRIPQADLWLFVLGLMITLCGTLILGFRKPRGKSLRTEEHL
eukprot:Rhum_TRINITY_DN21266_c0_g1::Rhum_TRINITY_DN21266_c0_g1_i1::g.173599::m.173599